MVGPKWSEMKKITDKDLRRKQKERDKIVSLKQEEEDKKSFRNTVIFAFFTFVLVIGVGISFYMVSEQKAEIEKIKELSSITITNPSGTLNFKEKGLSWTTKEKLKLNVNDSISTVPDGRIDILFQENRVATLKPESEIQITEIKPLPDMEGINSTAKLKKGTILCKMGSSTGYVEFEVGFAEVKLNPGTSANFKIEILKPAGKYVVRVAVQTGVVQAKFKKKPSVFVKGRKELIIHSDGKIDGPNSIIPGNEAWN